MRWNHYLYALIFCAIPVGWFATPWGSLPHLAVTVVGLGAMLVVGRLAGRRWGKL